jgi:fructose-1,6-bisphosphatase II
VDPLEGTRLTALGRPGAVSVIACAPRGTLYNPHEMFYMEKIAVGPEARGAIDLSAPVEWNIRQVAKAKSMPIEEVTVIILDRDRNTDIADQVRAAGARIKFITDGDAPAAVSAGIAGSGVDMMLGIGGSPEGVVAACALKCIGGDFQGRLWPRHDEDRKVALDRGVDLTQVLTINDLVNGDDVFFAATGVTGGDLLEGVEYTAGGAVSESLVMRSRSGTIRRIKTEHHWRKLQGLNISGH